MEEIAIKFIIFMLIMLTSFAKCKIPTIYVTEGDVAFLNFTYPCDSKEITLQRGNGAPFYNSRSSVPPSSSNLKLRNETNGEICFLYLTINPVSRDDEGGYILTAYRDGPGLFDDDRILLLLAYPPGKASCVLSEEYIDEDWFRLHCTASLGSIQGHIACYQDGIKIPTLNSPQQHDETLSQILLAKVGSLVYCCSGTLDETKDRCNCKDSVWDPTQNKQATNVTDPCPHIVPIQHPTFSQYPIEDNDNVSSSPSTKAAMIISQQPNSNNAFIRLQVGVGFFILVFIAAIAGTVCYFKRYSKKSASSNMESAVSEEEEKEEQEQEQEEQEEQEEESEEEQEDEQEEMHVLLDASRNLAYSKVEQGQCKDCASKVSGVKTENCAGIDEYDAVPQDDQNVVKDGHCMITLEANELNKPLVEKYNGRIDWYDGKWEPYPKIPIKGNIRSPFIVGCIDECNLIITDRLSGIHHTYMLDMNTEHTQRVITGLSDTSLVLSCAKLNYDKVVCGKWRKGCTGKDLTGCISVYDGQWKLIREVTIPRNTTLDVTIVNVADQDGMIIAAEWGQSKINVINPADGKIIKTITCKQDIVMRGVQSSGHIIAQPSPVDHRVFIIDREGGQREIPHSDVILNVCIDPMTDDLYVVTSDDECKTCVIDQLMIGGDMKKRRVASFPLSTRLKDSTELLSRNIKLCHLLDSRVMMTSSRNMIACDWDSVLIFKKMFSL